MSLIDMPPTDERARIVEVYIIDRDGNRVDIPLPNPFPIDADITIVPLPPDADPDRPERWRDHEEDVRGPEPDDVVDTEATWNAYERLCKRHGRDPWKPAMTITEERPCSRT